MKTNIFFGALCALVVTFLNTFYLHWLDYSPPLVAMGSFLLFFPWLKINNNLYSIFGGCNEDGSVYSIFSVHQFAGNVASAIVAFGIQSGGKRAEQFLGIGCFQISTNGDTSSIFSMGCIQIANGHALIGVALLSFSQVSTEYAEVVFGVIFFQFGKKEATLGAGLRCVVGGLIIKKETFLAFHFIKAPQDEKGKGYIEYTSLSRSGGNFKKYSSLS